MRSIFILVAALLIGAATNSQAQLTYGRDVSGVRKLLVMCAKFAGGEQACDVVSARAFFQTNTAPFYQQQSKGKLTIKGFLNPSDPADFVVTPIATVLGGCDAFTIRSQSEESALAQGYPLNMFGAYDNFVVIAPTGPCGFRGFADIGGLQAHAFINGFMMHEVIDHELGHAIPGFFHSNCSGGAYCDPSDIMGNRGGVFGAYERELVGWVNQPGMPTVPLVTTAGDVTINAIDGIGQIGIKVAKPTVANQFYYVTYHTGTWGSPTAGVVVHEAPDNSPSGSLYRDVLTGTGQTFEDAYTNVRFSVKSMDLDHAVVTVGFGVAPPPPSKPYTIIFPSTLKYNGVDTPVVIK